MKFSFSFIIFLLSFPLFANSINFTCQDIDLVGFEADDNYEKTKLYQQTTFDINLDLDNLNILSDGLNYTNPECGILTDIEGFDDFIYCTQYGYSFTFNLENFKFTRSRGFGYVMGDKDDIGIGYGECKINYQ